MDNVAEHCPDDSQCPFSKELQNCLNPNHQWVDSGSTPLFNIYSTLSNYIQGCTPIELETAISHSLCHPLKPNVRAAEFSLLLLLFVAV